MLRLLAAIFVAGAFINSAFNLLASYDHHIVNPVKKFKDLHHETFRLYVLEEFSKLLPITVTLITRMTIPLFLAAFISGSVYGWVVRKKVKRTNSYHNKLFSDMYDSYSSDGSIDVSISRTEFIQDMKAIYKSSYAAEGINIRFTQPSVDVVALAWLITQVPLLILMLYYSVG